MSGMRRYYLTASLKLLVVIGLILVSLPFIGSLMTFAPGGKVSKTNPWRVEVDVSALPAGEVKKVDWPGGEVWIYHRTPTDQKQHGGDEPYFVFLPRESKKGCRVSPEPLDDGSNGFTEPCYLARFDSLGRRLEDSGDPTQQDLQSPPHQWLSASRLRLAPAGGP